MTANHHEQPTPNPVWWESLLDLIFPPFCLHCRQGMERANSRMVCDGCWNKISAISEPCCPVCGYPTDKLFKQGCAKCPMPKVFFDRAVACVRFDGTLRKLIHQYKYKFSDDLVVPLSGLMKDPFRILVTLTTFDVMVPVPLHWTRYWWREFNQSLLIATQLHHLCDQAPPVNPNLLKRHRRTPQQTTLSPRLRAKNVRGTFSTPQPDLVAGKTILLVDDVYTTGATVNECARTLKHSGAKQVTVFTLARAV